MGPSPPLVMELATRARHALASVHLEPAVFLFYVSWGIFFVTSQQLYIEKACKVNLNLTEEVCDNIRDHKEVQVEAQKLVSAIQVRTLKSSSINVFYQPFK